MAPPPVPFESCSCGHHSGHHCTQFEGPLHPHHDITQPLRPLTVDLVMAFGEFIGTFVFLFMAYQAAGAALAKRAVVNGEPVMDNSTIMFVALSFGMSLLVTAWAFFRITGAALNPAVTFALWLIGGCSFRRAVLVTISQLAGGIAAAGVAKGLTIGPFNVANTLSEGYTSGRGVALEMFTTSLLCFTVLMLAAEKSKTTFLAPVCIGLSVFIGHLASIGWTGAGMNPARSLGPYVVSANFPGYCWLYFVGQMLGALLAVLYYIVYKQLQSYYRLLDHIDTSNEERSADPSKGPLFALFKSNELATRDVPQLRPVDLESGSNASSQGTCVHPGHCQLHEPKRM